MVHPLHKDISTCLNIFKENPGQNMKNYLGTMGVKVGIYG